MDERQSQGVLLVRAFEEEDHDGSLLAIDRRADATQQARAEVGDRVLIRRAALLATDLGHALPALSRLMSLARLRFAPAPAVIGLALGAGALTNVLGPQREINLLSIPLLGMLAWNGAIYTFWILSAFGLHAGSGRSADWLAQLALRRVSRWKAAPGAPASRARLVTAALSRFVGLWWKHAGRLLASRARRTLQLAAAAFALGAIGGMYLRGLAFEYQATWESTFLGVEAVERLLGWLLGPAAWLLGVQVPDLAPLRGPAGGGPAAIWIHLWAVTVSMVILFPRGLLAVLHGVRARRMAEEIAIDLGEGYFRRILATERAWPGRVEILPYSFEPGPAGTGLLRQALHDLFGARADVHLCPPLAYGEEPPPAVSGLPDAETRRSCRVVLFNLAQAPEPEVHGELLEHLKAAAGRDARLLVMVDQAQYRLRVADAHRIDERIRAWRRVVSETGLTAVFLDSQAIDRIESLADSMAEALWPAGGDA